MSIPPLHFERDELARHFGRVSALAGELSASGLTMDWISMGMSNDFELAIEHGSTCVRIGTAIFGPRDRQPA